MTFTRQIPAKKERPEAHRLRAFFPVKKQGMLLPVRRPFGKHNNSCNDDSGISCHVYLLMGAIKGIEWRNANGTADSFDCAEWFEHDYWDLKDGQDACMRFV